MSLNGTIREANVRDSIKKFMVDNIYTTEGIHITFDKSMSDPPTVQGKVVNRWVVVNWGPMVREPFASISIDVICATRKDNEGFKLAQLTDTVVGYLSDSETTDGLKRIILYRSRAVGAWDTLGSMLVHSIEDSGQIDAPDGTKYRILTVVLVWAAIV